MAAQADIQDLPPSMRGDALIELREKKNLSRDELADMMGISTDQLVNIETGRTRLSLDHFVSICEVFGVKPGRMFQILGVTFH